MNVIFVLKYVQMNYILAIAPITRVCENELRKLLGGLICQKKNF